MAMCNICKVVTFLFFLGEASAQVVLGRGRLTRPTFIVTAPTRARYDTVTTFSVSAYNVSEPSTIHLLLRTGSASEIILNDTTLFFNSDGVQTWSVVVDSDRMLQNQQNSVQLRAQYEGTIKVKDIPMNPLSGFILIQTDKVIYSPGQTVMYRVIALDDDQRFAQWPVTVDIKNPDLIILERQHHTSRDAFMGRNFSLSRDATPGTWSVTAYYDGTKVRTTKTVTFDVEEYVLPTFKVEVSAVEKVISLSTNWIQIRTKAVYSYGRPVHGTAVLRLGVVGITTVFPFNTTYSGVLDNNGEWNYSVPVRDLRSHRAWFPDGSRLYLIVNVTDAGTGEMGTAVAMDTFFAHPYYQISVTDSKMHFKPGFHYNLAMHVTAANGDPASNSHVYVIVEIKDHNNVSLNAGFSSVFELDEHGRHVESIMVPPDASIITFNIYTVDPSVPDWVLKEFTVHKFVSDNNHYLQLSYTPESKRLSIGYTPLAYGNGQLITVLILSRGRLVHSFTVPLGHEGHVTYPLSHEVLLAAAPTARVVAYFYTRGRMSGEIISDALLIDTPDNCREEMRLGHVSQSAHGGQLDLLPKQRTELDVFGGPHMHVGLLAVDKAVYFLRDERSLTRAKMFSILGEADEGRGVGDGINVDKIFEHAGLQYMMLTNERIASQPKADSSLNLPEDIFIPDLRHNQREHWTEVASDEEQIPLEMVRRYFPESWLFREITLPRNGFTSEPITLPDSITTWTFTAVGVGQDGGVCMTRPLELVTFKPFFAQVRLPYKAVRLEAIEVNIGIYNYKPFDINVTVTVRGDLGLCFSDSVHNQQFFAYRALLHPHHTNSESVRVIPLVAGNIKLLVDVQSNNGRERDIVEKTLYVVPEGRRVQKSITFPLDPSGEHSSHQAHNHRGMQRTHTATITNRINSQHQRQLTDILLYMPEEVIQGSERCQISACGDLMGDIISTSVVNGDNLFESNIVDAEEVIGNLAPPVHALLYLNRSQIMTPVMLATGQKYVKHGVSRLEAYRKQDGSFSLTPDSLSATWLTALVLKTLCHVEQITFVDHEAFVMRGFAWLLDQVYQDGKLLERDHRLARPSQEYDLMLSAETLIALHECQGSRTLLDDDLELMGRQEMLLNDHVEHIHSPLVLAKTAYALTLSDPYDPITQQAAQRLSAMKRTTLAGLHFWSVSLDEDDPVNRPFWYHSGSKASAIEATAYALLVFSKQEQAYADYQDEELPEWAVNLDAIAGWLIQKRNSRGAFIGAMDTAAATQALSEYSLSKLGVSEVNLHCSVSTSPLQNYSHSFDFNEDNAITPKSLSNVPVGRQLLVETQGTGLGQMQVRVQYNVPVEANAHCQYNVTITRRAVSFTPLHHEGDEVCQYCLMGCDDDDSAEGHRDGGRNGGRGVQGSVGERRQRPSRRRYPRQIIASRVTICIEVCIRSADNMYADRTILDINMLTGFQPVGQDLERVYEKRETLSLSSLSYVPERTSVEMKFNQVPHNRSTCVSFRAIEQHDVERRNPAIVTVRSHEDQEPTCITTYDPVVSEVNLEVYCANNQSNNQGQCRCFSGLCGQCYPRTSDVSYNFIRSLTCSSEFIYKIGPPSFSPSDDWVEMTVDVIDVAKNGSVAVDSQIQLVTPRNCNCPHRSNFSGFSYFFGSRVDIFVDRNNNRRKTYLVDQSTTFVSSSFIRHRNPDRTADFIHMALQSCSN